MRSLIKNKIYYYFKMIIHKSFSKTDLIDLINTLGLKVVFSHQDNKKDIQDKLLKIICEPIDIKSNFYKIENKDGLIQYLQNINSKKTLSIKEKNNVMALCKHIIQYCKNDYDLNFTKYSNYKELQDDMDFIKQFGDIPSCRRCCRLMNSDPYFKDIKFIALISPQIQKDLNDKKTVKKGHSCQIKVRKSTPDNPIILYFD
tara:strand:+ start:406 stop:1008 length:603 start_codon:yes stop_codon:yes gene_type:complete